MESKLGLLTRTVSFVQRYQQIIFVMLKYGFEDIIANLRLDYLQGGRKYFFRKRKAADVERLSRAARMRLALEELGPTFVKMGQALSTRSDLLPEDILTEFSLLQDHVHPFPAAKARKILEAELEAPLDELFMEFHDTPIAAGSIGQVHRAKTLDGEDVAVKIQRPDIRHQIKVDLEIIHYIATLMERHLELGQIHKPTRIADEFARTLRQELDYRIEAANIQRFDEMFHEDPTIYVHRVYRDLSTDRIIVTEFLKGAKPNDHQALKRLGLDPRIIASKGADSIISQVFIHGFFHADPHPGNILVMEDHLICFLDFGMMGRLDRASQELFADLLMNIISRDEVKAADNLLKLTHGHSLVNRPSLEREISELIDQYLYLSLKDLEIGRLIRSLLNLTVKYELGLPAHYFLLIKAITQIEDLGRQLDPDFDFAHRAKPYVRKLIMNRYHPKRVMRDIYETSSDLVYLIKEVPGEMRELLKQARQGKFKIELDHHRIQPLIHTMERISNRVSSAIVLASMIVGSSLIVHAKIPPVWYNIPVIGLVGYLVSGLMGISLLRSIWRSNDE